MNIMLGKFNIDISIGDRVLFAKGGQQDTDLYSGTVEDIYEKHNKIFCKVRCDISKSLNERLSKNILKLQPIMDAYPEEFI